MTDFSQVTRLNEEAARLNEQVVGHALVLERDLEAARQEIGRLGAELRATDARLATVAGERAEFESRLQETSERLANELRLGGRTTAEVAAERGELVSRLEAKQERLAAVEAERDEANRLLAEAREQARTREGQVAQARAHTEETQLRLEQVSDQVETAARLACEERDEARAEAERLRRALDTSEQALRERDEALAVAETQISKGEAKHLRERLTEESGRADGLSQQLDRALATLAQERAERLADVERLSAEGAAEADRLRAEMAALQQRLRQVEAQFEDARTEVVREGRERRAVEQRNAFLEQQLSALTVELEDERDQHTRTRNALEDRIRV